MNDRSSSVTLAPALENAIAVVGMALRVPGARSVTEYWQNLRDGVESITRLSDEELEAAGVPAAEVADPSYVKAGAFLEDIDLWDAGFFGFNPREAAVMDPQHRQFLECAWEALELAGHRPDRFPGAIGVFAGSGMGTYFWRNVLSDPELLRSTGFFLLRHTGNDKDFLATRVSYCFNLKGPSVSVQTACSTSLVAVHMAAQSLLNGECDMALAGGVTIEVPHRRGYVYEEGEILSPDGHCRPFDAAAAGTVFGSGAAVVVLRRLEDALASGDTVHAIIRGSAINNDGSTKVGYLAPSVDGQAAAIAEALELAGVPADTIGFVEAHGTGTAVGDPIEVTALTQAFRARTDRRGFCALGSVKSNIGHLDTAAGAVGLIKTVEALKHGEIPPTVHFTTPHPAIDWESSPFYVNGERRTWPAGPGSPRRAGVSSLGVGGTNAHVVLEEAPAPLPADPDRGAQLLLLSARSRSAVERRASDLASALEEQPEQGLADVAFTLSAGRTPFRVRRFVVAEDRDEAIDALLAAGPGHEPVETHGERRPVAFLFAGGGTQYAGMGRELYEREPVYREVLDRCLEIAARHGAGAVRELLLADGSARDDATRMLERPSLALPALFATQYALAKLLTSWGIKPAAMLGHSMGEYTAACLSGVFTLEDAMAVVALRGRLFERVEPGAMTSVPLAADRLRELLTPDLSVAAENAPDLSVASGPLAAIEALEARLREQDVECRRIHIDTAAHSALLEPVLDEFRAFLTGLRLGEPAIPFASNLSGTWAGSDVRDAGYWVRHLRETVRFSDGLAALLDQPDLVLLEIGPGRTLGTLARLHPERGGREPLATMPRFDEPIGARRYLLDTVGRLWQQGVEPDWDGFWADERRRRVPLPTYPFERESHWIEARTVAVATGSETTGAGRRADVTDWFSRPEWVRQDVAPRIATDVRTVIIADELGVGVAAARRVRDAGGEAVVVRAGAGFRRDGDDITIDPDVTADWDALIRAVMPGGRPLAFLHLRNLDDVADADVDQLERIAFGQPLELLRALVRAGPDVPVRIVFAGDRAAGMSVTTPGNPLRALLAGPARVASRELPDTRAQLVDTIAPDGADWRAEQLAAQLLAELAGEGTETVVALRGRERWVQRSGRWQPTDGESAPLLRENAVVLITGGTGGIGRTIARDLHERASARLVLVSRTGLPPEDTWPALIASGVRGRVADAVRDITELRRAGAQIEVEVADVTDTGAMRGVVERTLERFGAIHGVIHAAGTLDDGLIAYKTDASAEAVLAPKVRGTLALDAATADLPLDFMLLFSSRSAVTGAPGQVDYTAANAFIDAFARHRSETTGRAVVSVAWDAWREVGMVADLERRAHGERDESHPVLHRRSAHGESVVFEGELDVDRHWVVAEHRVRDGDAILPGSAYVDLARTTWLLETGDPRVEIHDLMLVAPLAVNGEPRDLRMRITPAGPAHELTVLSRLSGDGDAPWIVHARGRIHALGTTRRLHDVDGIRARCRSRRQYDGVVPHAHLAFGARWAALRSVAFGDGEALAELELPESFAGDLADWGLHPALIDLATGAGQPLVPGYDADSDFYVPASYAAVRVHRPLPRRFYSHLRYHPPADGRNKDLAVFDVVLMDDMGEELASFDEFVMVRMEGHAGIGHALASAPTEPDLPAAPAPASPAFAVADGIEPAEGTRALAMVLTPGAPSHVLVTPRELGAILAEVSAIAAPSADRGRRAKAAELPDVAPVEEALAGHEAVREAAAVAHAEARNRVRIVAFVVQEPGRRATVSELRRYLRERVPDGLVPNSFVELTALPRTVDGAIDRAALPDPFANTDDFVPPRTPTERAIAAIWRDLLGVDRVGARDNFLDIGGHSLLGVRALLLIEKATGVRLHPNALTIQTLAQLAAECDRLSGTAVASDGPGPGESDGALPRRLLTAMRHALKGGGGR